MRRHCLYQTDGRRRELFRVALDVRVDLQQVVDDVRRREQSDRIDECAELTGVRRVSHEERGLSVVEPEFVVLVVGRRVLNKMWVPNP